MLSAEESRLWDSLAFTKFDQPFVANQHLCRTRPLLEGDLVAAIATLKESTVAIEVQADSLRRHKQDILPDAFKGQPRGCERATQDLINPIGRKDALEFQQLRFAIGEEIGAFTSSFNSASEDALQIRKTTEWRVTQRLHQDDQELDALQKIALPREAVADSAIGSDWKALRLVKRLVDFTCEETQCRLDRIYLEQLHGHLKHANGIDEGTSDQEFSLKSDLDSLYAEIRDVVAISVSQEFEYPLLKSRQNDRHYQRASENLSSERILRALSRSRQSLEAAVDGLESFCSYRKSLDAIYAIYQRIGATVEVITRHSSLVSPIGQEPPVEEAASRALLRHIGISDENFVDRGSLEHDLSRKVTKLRAPSLISASPADDSLSSILETNNASSQTLSRTYLGHLEATSAATLDASLGALDDEIGLLKGKVEDINLSKAVSPKQFLNRWAPLDSC